MTFRKLIRALLDEISGETNHVPRTSMLVNILHVFKECVLDIWQKGTMAAQTKSVAARNPKEILSLASRITYRRCRSVDWVESQAEALSGWTWFVKWGRNPDSRFLCPDVTMLSDTD